MQVRYQAAPRPDQLRTATYEWRTDRPGARIIIAMPRQQARVIAFALIRAGLTVRDVAELLGAHPRAVAALLA